MKRARKIEKKLKIIAFATQTQSAGVVQEGRIAFGSAEVTPSANEKNSVRIQILQKKYYICNNVSTLPSLSKKKIV